MRLNGNAESISELRQDVRKEIAAIAEPLAERLRNVDAIMQDRLDDLQTLREARREIVVVLRPLIGDEAIPLEPGRNAKPGPKKQQTKTSPQSRVSPERVEEALTWLRENASGDGKTFTTKTIQDAVGMSSATASAIAAVLVEREQARRTKVGKAGVPHEYALVT